MGLNRDKVSLEGGSLFEKGGLIGDLCRVVRKF